MPNPVQVPDLEARFRPLTEAETTVARSLLDDAWEELLVRVPDLEDRMHTTSVTDGLIRRVVSAMVIRVLRNPEAIQRWAVDDASFTRDQMVASGLLYATPEEVAMLSGAHLGPVGHVAFSASFGPGRA